MTANASSYGCTAMPEASLRAASHPVNENGIPAAFREEQDARRRCDRLNADRGNADVFFPIDTRPR